MSLALTSLVRARPKFFGCLVFLATLLWLSTWQHSSPTDIHEFENDDGYPSLVREHIDLGFGRGGRWYIPPSWTDARNDFDYLHPTSSDVTRRPQTPAEAATLALDLALRGNRFLNNTKIPLIIHQTWKSLQSRTWSPLVRDSVNDWLEVAVGGDDPDFPAAAYIMWDDEGVEQFMKTFEEPSYEAVEIMPYKVEKADFFRVAVLKWFGGIYADIDTKPLKHPALWVQKEDIQPWSDPASGLQYTLHEPKFKSYQPPQSAPLGPAKKATSWADSVPTAYRKIIESSRPDSVDVAAIVGIEADNRPDGDEFWRMGYSYPLQLTNWAMAMAPQHPIAFNYLEHVTHEVLENASRLQTVEILDLTGPPAFTQAVKGVCEWDDPTFRWTALSGRANPANSTGKVAAGDILVLPITGFSPGRLNVWPHKSMGSQPVDHPQARLFHEFAGSWRHRSAKVEAGKLCRTFLGRCRYWSKTP